MVYSYVAFVYFVDLLLVLVAMDYIGFVYCWQWFQSCFSWLLSLMVSVIMFFIMDAINTGTLYESNNLHLLLFNKCAIRRGQINFALYFVYPISCFLTSSCRWTLTWKWSLNHSDIYMLCIFVCELFQNLAVIYVYFDSVVSPPFPWADLVFTISILLS